jgi:hypothetical protein
MKSWLALVLAPSVALGAQSLMYSLVTPACGSQTRLQLHLAAAVVLAVVAFGESSLRRGEPASHDSDAAHPRGFLATMGTAVAALSALVILGMWFALWVLTPCEP